MAAASYLGDSAPGRKIPSNVRLLLLLFRHTTVVVCVGVEAMHGGQGNLNNVRELHPLLDPKLSLKASTSPNKHATLKPGLMAGKSSNVYEIVQRTKFTTTGL